MAPRPRVLVVQHEDDCPVGMIEPWLERAGLLCDVLRAHEGRALPASLAGYAALVVLGGTMGADDDHDHRHLVPTKALIAGTVAAGLPYLGVCLGHQLAASALGGEVRRNPAGQSLGITAFTPTAEGVADPLTSALPAGTPVLHWNDDVVLRLPEGATRLATSPDGEVQAARYGAQAWGVQFHPEVTVEVVARWPEGRDPDREQAAVEAVRTRQAELHRGWEPLVRRFGRLALAEAPA